MSPRALIRILAVVVFGVLVALFFRANLGGNPERGMHGLDLTLPADVRELPGESADLPEAAGRALDALAAEPGGRVAVRYREAGVAVELVIDPAAAEIDERRVAESGTLRRVFWSGPVERRLRWAAGEGSLAAPDLPKSESRNLYH